MTKTDEGGGRPLQWVVMFGGGLLLALVLLEFLDVTLRWVANSPLNGSVELVEVGIAVVAFACLPFGFARNQHICADFLQMAFGDRGRLIMQLSGSVISVMAMAAVAWALSLSAIEQYVSGEFTGALRLPVYPFWFAVAALAWGSVFAAMFGMLSTVRQLRGRGRS